MQPRCKDVWFYTQKMRERQNAPPSSSSMCQVWLSSVLLPVHVGENALMSTAPINVLENCVLLHKGSASRDQDLEADGPGACEANRGRLLFYGPVSSSSPFIHLMEAAGLLPMAVQVSSVSFPSLTTSSRLSMIGLPGGTDPQRWQHLNMSASQWVCGIS